MLALRLPPFRSGGPAAGHTALHGSTIPVAAPRSGSPGAAQTAPAANAVNLPPGASVLPQPECHAPGKGVRAVFPRPLPGGSNFS